ncbi:unnamed protein product [Ixodes persulcatus]
MSCRAVGSARKECLCARFVRCAGAQSEGSRPAGSQDQSPEPATVGWLHLAGGTVYSTLLLSRVGLSGCHVAKSEDLERFGSRRRKLLAAGWSLVSPELRLPVATR